MGIDELPEVPVLKAICALVSQRREFSMNFSLRRFHMKPTDQKPAQRFEAPKREEPSVRSEKSA